MGTDIDSEDYESLGGLIIEHLDRLPNKGDSVKISNCKLTVIKMDEKRIDLVKVQIDPEVEKTEDRETVYELAGDFTKSYFQEEYTGDVQIKGIKGLSGVGADNSTDCTVEVEFLPAQEDSLSYLFMTFEKDGTEWTIRSYGLEK